MADEKTYSFITVGTDDDDDVVIQAGASARVEFGGERSSETADREADFACEVEPAEPEPEPASAAPSSCEPAASEEPPSTPAAPVKKGEYRETTLEDLDSSPMGATQKVVIAAAVVAIVAFIVYLLL